MESDITFPVRASLHSLRYLSVHSYIQLSHEVYWAQLTALTELQQYSIDEGFPAVLGGMTGLRRLTIQSADVSDLPAGPDHVEYPCG